jgi:hypothetical protein
MSLPSTHGRAVGGAGVENAYAPAASTSTWPVQRMEKVSAPMPMAGEPLPHEKLTFGSVRESLGLVRSALSKYAALRTFATWASAWHPRSGAGGQDHH